MRTEKLFSFVMAFMEHHPCLVKTIFRPLANAPLLSRYIPVIPRAYLGATAFEIHDVDLSAGRIGIGGVDEVIFSSKFLEAFHSTLQDMMGSLEQKQQALYRVGKEGGYWEVNEALKHGKWGPPSLVKLIENGSALSTLRTDPEMHRFFIYTMKMVSRIIINEGGWGAVDEIDIHADPMRVSLLNSNEARWVGPSNQPVCSLCSGVIAGYASRIFKQDLDATEVQCISMGASKCIFELTDSSGITR